MLAKKFSRELSELEYIVATGPDRAGALAFSPDLGGPKMYLPDGSYASAGSSDLDVALSLRATDDALANVDSKELRSFLQYGSSLGGARPKACIRWRGKPYLAKFSVRLDEHREPLIEYATMNLARKLGLDVPDIELAQVERRDVFLIRRFDRSPAEDSIPYISGLTVMALHEQDYDRWSYPLLAQAIVRLSDQPTQDLEELFRRVTFNVLVNNDDDHPRNHGFLHVGKNKWRLSPLFDVVPRNQLGETFRLALNIGDYGKQASKQNVLSAAKYFSLSSNIALEIWDELETSVMEAWEQEFKNAGLSNQEISSFHKSIGTK